MGRRDAGGVLGRRGLLAGAAALVAGGLAKLGDAERAEAGHDINIAYDSQTVMHVNVGNTTTDRTGVFANIGQPAFVAVNGSANSFIAPSGLQGITSQTAPYPVAGAGVHGVNVALSGNAIGVLGTALPASGIGVYGIAGNSNPTVVAPPGTGVFGTSNAGTGVYGLSGDGNGVFGVSTNASGAYGFSNYSYGVIGNSNVGVGVQALSSTNWGLHAQSSSSFAGVFSGPVFINGSITVTQGPKSAAVKRRDGSHARMYCQESPEPWFEDFGEGTLTNGRAAVRLDPDFADIVKADRYHVYLTPRGDSKGLYVSSQGPATFEVREQQGGASTLDFHYRVVARRKDPVGGRLEKVDVPDFTKLKPLPPLPPDLSGGTERPGR